MRKRGENTQTKEKKDADVKDPKDPKGPKDPKDRILVETGCLYMYIL